jgi:hypothetical protein
LEGLAKEKNGMFYEHFEYITAIWYFLWPFGNLVEIWYIFNCLGISYQEKSGNPGYIIAFCSRYFFFSSLQ